MVVMPLYLLYNDIEKKTCFSILIIILPVLNGFFDSVTQPRKVEVCNISLLRSWCHGFSVCNRNVIIETYVLRYNIFVPQLSFLLNFICYFIYIMGLTSKNFTVYYESIKKTEEEYDIEKGELLCQEQLRIVRCRDKLKINIRIVLNRNDLNLLRNVVRTLSNFYKTDEHNIREFLKSFQKELDKGYNGTFDLSSEFFNFSEIDGIIDVKFIEEMTNSLS
jgi:hypothetical protein